MDKQLQEQIKRIANNELTVEALKNVFFARVRKEELNIEDKDKDEVLGQKYRAFLKAKSIVEKSFEDIDAFNTKKSIKNNFNKER